MYTIDFTSEVKKIMAKWKKSDPMKFKKLSNILDDIQEHPRTGIGHPHPLKGGQDITYSRHITKWDRIIYDIYNEEIHVLVVELEGHYDDK